MTPIIKVNDKQLNGHHESRGVEKRAVAICVPEVFHNLPTFVSKSSGSSYVWRIGKLRCFTKNANGYLSNNLICWINISCLLYAFPGRYAVWARQNHLGQLPLYVSPWSQMRKLMYEHNLNHYETAWTLQSKHKRKPRNSEMYGFHTKILRSTCTA